MGILDVLSGGLPSPIPDAVAAPLAIGQPDVNTAPPINEQLPSYRSAFIQKYQDPEVSQLLQGLTPDQRQGLLTYDSGRVANGSPPLTREQTLGAINTIRTGQPATPVADRSILNVPGNAVQDLGNILKSLPRLPVSLLHEAEAIATPSKYGHNILQAPGIRLLPGAYTLGNILNGGKGVKEALTHPLITALDLLPGAEAAAKLTPAGSLAEEAAKTSGLPARALHAALTQTVDEAGELTPNRLGRATAAFRNDTRPGQFLSQIGGKDARNMSRAMAERDAQIKGLSNGQFLPDELPESVRAVGQVAKDNADLARKYNLTPEESIKVFEARESGDTSGLDDRLLAFNAEHQGLVQKMADYHVQTGAQGTLTNPDGTLEYVDARTANRISQLTRKHAFMSSMSNIRDQLLDPDPTRARAPVDIAKDFDALTTDVTRPKAVLAPALRALTMELRYQGFDTSALTTAIDFWKREKHASIDAVRDKIPEVLSSAPSAPPYTIPDILGALKSYTRHPGDFFDKQAFRIYDSLKDGNTRGVADSLRNIERRATAHPEEFSDPAFADSIRLHSARYRLLDEHLSSYTPTRAYKVESQLNASLDRATPARWRPITQGIARKSITDYFTPHDATPEEAAAIATKVTHQLWDQLPDYEPGDTERMVNKISQDAAMEWRKLQEAGVNPQFVHHFNPDQIHQAVDPTISEVPNSVKQLKERAANASPYAKDVTLALSHSANEILRRHYSEEVITHIVQNFGGVKEQSLRGMLEPRAVAYQAAHPQVDMEAAFQRVAGRSYTKFDPAENGYEWGSPKLNSLRDDSYWIPKALAKNLKMLHDPKAPLGAVFEPITKTFRYAVVGLSPRTLLNNWLGGATMTSMEAGPAAFRFISEARKFDKNPELMLTDPRFSPVFRSLIGSETQFLKDLDLGNYSGDVYSRIYDTANVMKGRTLGRLWGEIQSHARPITDALGNAARKSFEWNGQADNMYKIMAYLQGYDKSISKGLSEEAAQRVGLELARRTQPDWHALTPIERSIMKSVFPFYGFTSHAVRYVMRYPIDHPLRAQFIGKFGEMEAEDNEALPGNFLGSLFIGHSGGGHERFANLTGFNPFGDLANMMTFAGFLSATNPAIQTVLESAGVVNGQAELYPTLRYDPESGRLQAVHGNPLLSLVGNTIPQSQVALALLGANSDFNGRVQSDPAGAYRSLLSGAGIPLLYRDYNIPAEQAKAEVAREKSTSAVLAAAKKSGNWSTASRYPTLSSELAKVRALTPDQVAQFQPRKDESQQLMDALQNAQGQPRPSASIQQLGNTGGI